MILDFTQLEEEAAQKLKTQQKAADDWKCYFVFARVISLCRLSLDVLCESQSEFLLSLLDSHQIFIE